MLKNGRPQSTPSLFAPTFFLALAVILGGLIGCVPGTEPGASAPISCGGSTALPTSPEVLASIPALREFLNFEDPAGDFIRNQPFFEENFDAEGVFERSKVPAALDLRSIRVGPEGDTFMFQVGVAQDEDGPTLRELLTDSRRTAQVGVYIDTDHNGVSDYLFSTTSNGERGLIVTREVNERVTDVEVRLDDYEITVFIPEELIGDRFDWSVFTGFTPIEGAFFRTELDVLFFLPQVDVYHPQDIPINVGFTTTYSGTGRQCFVTTSAFNSCPAQGNPALVQVPNTSYQGVLLYDVRCDGRGYDFWCLSQSFFGKHVYDVGQQGWVAKCPYPAGCNQEKRWDQDGDGLVDKIIHTVFDADGNCSISSGPTHRDSDGDGKLDLMKHTYLYASNQVTSCNLNLDYVTKTVASQTCKPAQAPYANPGAVPGSIGP